MTSFEPKADENILYIYKDTNIALFCRWEKSGLKRLSNLPTLQNSKWYQGSFAVLGTLSPVLSLQNTQVR